MKELVAKVLILLVSLYLVDLSAGMLLDYLRDHAPDGRYQKATYTLYTSREDVLVLGSSKGESNFIPSVIENSLELSCWNASRGGQGLPYFQAITRGVLSRHTPKLVLLNLETDILSTPLKYEEAGFLRPYYTSVQSIRDVLDKSSTMSWLFNKSRLYQYNSSFYYLLRPYLLNGLDGDSSQQGWKPRSGTIEKPFKREHIRQLIDSKAIFPEAKEMLISIVNNFKEHGTSVCFVVSPDYGEITEHSESLDAIYEIARTYKIPVFDFANKPDYAADESLFVDIQHLNKEGALRFTRDVLAEISNALTNHDISISISENRKRNDRTPNTEVY